MRKALASLLIVFALAFGISAVSMADETGTTVGGHVKLTIFDTVDGVRTTTGGVKYGSSEYMGFSFGEVIFFVSQKISEVFSVELQPSFRGSTGATPKLGKNIGDQVSTTDYTFGGFDRALVKYIAPMDVEISAGIVKPKFTVEYGQELFWDEEYNGSKFAANPWLGEMADSGIEIYKSFTVSDISLPIWLYALNGTGSPTTNDSNKQPAFMIHAEPAWGMFKLMGSYTVGTYDNGKQDAYQRTSGGLQFNWEGVQLRTELANGRWENKMGKGIDATSYGYYVKAIYKFTPWLKLVYDFNVAAHNFNGFFFTANLGGEKYITNTGVIDINITDSTFLMFQLDYANWMQNNGKDGLNFIRPTLALRTTF